MFLFMLLDSQKNTDPKRFNTSKASKAKANFKHYAKNAFKVNRLAIR